MSSTLGISLGHTDSVPGGSNDFMLEGSSLGSPLGNTDGSDEGAKHGSNYCEVFGFTLGVDDEYILGSDE